LKIGPYGCTDFYFDYTGLPSSLLVYKPAGDFITGGGSIKTYNSGGLFSAYPGSLVNFGFHVKFKQHKQNRIQMTIPG
jgi:hypothetical protein